jgi:hypothetical protein
MAYDEVKKTLLLYGGSATSRVDKQTELVSTRYDTWAFDGKRWKQEPVSGPQIKGPFMAYDSARKRPILYGGPRPISTWAWDGAAWNEIPGSGWPQLFSASLAYDEARRVVVAYGDVNQGHAQAVGGTWTWDGTVWTEANPGTQPQVFDGTAMTYDERSRLILIFGGSTR